MVKQVFSLFLLLFSSQMMFAQLELATKNYQEAIKIANDNPVDALESINQVLKSIEPLGNEGDELRTTIYSNLPTIQYNAARRYYEQEAMEKSLATFEAALETATKQENEEIAKQVKTQLPSLYYSYGNSLIKASAPDKALENYRKALLINDGYAKAYYGIGKTFRGANIDSVEHYTIKAIELAKSNPKEAASYKKGLRIQLSKHAGKEAKSKNHKKAITLYQKALEYTQPKDEKNLSKYNYKLGKSYQALKEINKACAAYKKVKDAKYLKSAKYEIEQTLGCK